MFRNYLTDWYFCVEGNETSSPGCRGEPSKHSPECTSVPHLLSFPLKCLCNGSMQSAGEGLPRFSANPGPASPFLPFLTLYANLQEDKGLSLKGSFRRIPFWDIVELILCRSSLNHCLALKVNWQQAHDIPEML